KPGAFAIHNTNYWMGIPYLGVGPSAHSYNGKTRQHNPSNNNKYIKAIDTGALIFELEEINARDNLNEYLLTSLRTMWGADTALIRKKYKIDLFKEKSTEINQLVQDGWMA